MTALPLPLAQAYAPVTFLERGVLVPFTTPMLAGTRARPADPAGTELLVPNLAGGRGVYVLLWRDIHTLCCPTVHDRRLNRKVEALRSVTPGSIRQAAREVAAEGLAGREARVAAIRAGELDQQARRRAHFLFLLQTLEQISPGGLLLDSLSEPSVELQQHACRVIIEQAPRLGLAPTTVIAELEHLAQLFEPIGIAGLNREARVPQLLQQVGQVQAQTSAWSQAHANASGELARLLAEAAGATLASAAGALGEAQELAQDVVALLRQWRTQQAAVVRIATRPEWLLDGWQQVCLLWEDAEMPGAREAALAEMVIQAPLLPRETREWTSLPLLGAGRYVYSRRVRAQEDWRTGDIGRALVSRNERLQARLF